MGTAVVGLSDFGVAFAIEKTLINKTTVRSFFATATSGDFYNGFYLGIH
jgi:hypothetical protein